MACTVNSDVAVQTLDLVKQVRTPPVLSEVPHELSTASHSKECKQMCIRDRCCKWKRTKFNLKNYYNNDCSDSTPVLCS